MTAEQRTRDEHRVEAVLAARSRMTEAFRGCEIDVLDELFSSDLVVVFDGGGGGAASQAAATSLA